MLPAYLIAILLATSSPSVLTAHLIVDPIEQQKTEWIEKLHQCENGGNLEKWIDSNNKYSYGFVAFQMSTWLSYGKKLGATKENINNDELQKIVARSMLDKGLWRHWYTCSKIVSKSLGDYPIETLQTVGFEI
jgi:hypothetical protein